MVNAPWAPDFAERDVPEEVVDRIAPSIGLLMLNFAILEQGLHVLNSNIHDIFTAKSRAKKLPTKFSKVVESLHDSFKTVPELWKLTDDAKIALDDASYLAGLRNIISHATLSHFYEGSGPNDLDSVVFIKVKFTSHIEPAFITNHRVAVAVLVSASDRLQTNITRVHRLITAVGFKAG